MKMTMLLLVLLPAACLASTAMDSSAPWQPVEEGSPAALDTPSPASAPSSHRQGRLLSSVPWFPSWGSSRMVPPPSPYSVIPMPSPPLVGGGSGAMRYYDADPEVAAAARNNDEQRALSLFGINLLNPLQLLTNPFAIDTTLLNTALTLKKPFAFDFKNVIARATIAANGVANSNLQGEIVFFQEDWKKPIVVLIALTGAGTAASQAITVEIRPNQDVTNACGNVGANTFNPTGALNGGVLVSGSTTTAEQNFATILPRVPIDRATLLGATSIINRSILVTVNNVVNGCGTILKQTTQILGR